MSQKVIKWAKEGAVLIGGYSNYYCRGLFYSIVSFGFIFTVLEIQLSSLLSLKQVYIYWSHRLLAGYLQCKIRLMHCKVLLYCIWKGFKAIVMFLAYSDSLVFLLIDLLPTKAEPA